LPLEYFYSLWPPVYSHGGLANVFIALKSQVFIRQGLAIGQIMQGHIEQVGLLMPSVIPPAKLTQVPVQMFNAKLVIVADNTPFEQ
jgi:hypothetical protein